MHFCIHPETGSSSEANGAEKYCALYNFVTKACRNSGPCQVVDLFLQNYLRTSIAGFIISRHSEEVKTGPLFGNQFKIDPSTVPNAFQLEFIDIQNHNDFDGIFSKLLTFYAKYVSEETSPNLVRLALRNISLFGSSYCCEQLFSIMKNVKAKSRSLRSDEYLSGVLTTATSTVGADIDGVHVQAKTMSDLSLNLDLYKA